METKTDLQKAIDSYVELGGSLDDLTVTTRHIVVGRLWCRHSYGDVCDQQLAFTDWDQAVNAANDVCNLILECLEYPLCNNDFAVCVYRDVPVVIVPESEEVDLPHCAYDDNGTVYHYGYDFDWATGLVVAYSYNELGRELPDMTLRNDRDMWFKA